MTDSLPDIILRDLRVKAEKDALEAIARVATLAPSWLDRLVITNGTAVALLPVVALGLMPNRKMGDSDSLLFAALHIYAAAAARFGGGPVPEPIAVDVTTRALFRTITGGREPPETVFDEKGSG